MLNNNKYTLTGKTSIILKSAVKKGFTLAEVLITLGIIGVVAAMTMPALMTSISKKQTEAKLKKAVAIINQAYQLSYNDNGNLSAEEAFQLRDEYFKTYWQPYIKADICNSYQECGYTSMTPWKFLNGSQYTLYVVVKDQRTTFYTPDGILYVILTAGGKESNWGKNSSVVIDINGGKPPNIVGKDVFLFSRVQSDNGVSIIPQCNDNSLSEVNSSCSKTGNGVCCAEKIRRAG